MQLTFKVEHWRDVVEEMKPLMTLHWMENGNWQDKFGLDPDWEMYGRLDDVGILCVVIARNLSNTVVGYYMSMVYPNPHYRTVLFSYNDAYWLDPQYRNAVNGVQLLQAYENAMREIMIREGKQFMPLIGRARLAMKTRPLFERLGWTEAESCMTKLIEADNG